MVRSNNELPKRYLLFYNFNQGKRYYKIYLLFYNFHQGLWPVCYMPQTTNSLLEHFKCICVTFLTVGKSERSGCNLEPPFTLPNKNIVKRSFVTWRQMSLVWFQFNHSYRRLERRGWRAKKKRKLWVWRMMTRREEVCYSDTTFSPVLSFIGQKR